MNKEKYRTKRIEEYKIGARTHDKIRDLLRRGFTGYPADRSYFQQIPTFRYLVYQEKQLIGHMAVEHRMINMSEEVYAIFGIVDFCVDPDFQSLRIATHLLSEVEAEARKYGIDFLVLVAKDHGLYEKMGYQLRENICRWLIIERSMAS